MEGHEMIDDKSQQMLSRADQLLAAVDESFIVKERGHEIRPLPTFTYDEITLGKVLGTGGFGIVYDIANITVDRSDHSTGSHVPHLDRSNEPLPVEGSDQNELPSINAVQLPQNHDTVDTEDVTNSSQHHEVSSIRSVASADVYSNSNLHVHYSIHKAKDWMEKCCCLTSSKEVPTRYALKRLQKGLTKIERSRGMLDLALEAKFLSIVWHPNIIKIRGVAEGEKVHDNFFIIIDRLCQTLDVRMDVWRAEIKKLQNTGIPKLLTVFFGASTKSQKSPLEQLLLDRLTVCYDLASALMYLHEHKIVYRDIKPENIGFDHRGDVKLFDFGLCKDLTPSLKAYDGGYGYRLTGQAGSLPYMAPEVVLGKTYDSKCDVFSFAILLWEMLSLQECCKGYTPEKFVDRVTIHQKRFAIQKSWPPLTRYMIQEAWDNDPQKRPDMTRVAIIIRGDLNNMTTDDMVVHRTLHMLDRSVHEYIQNSLDLIIEETSNCLTCAKI